jgi:hypothetical protein
MPVRGEDYVYIDSANLLVLTEDRLAQLLNLLTARCFEIEENICKYAPSCLG